MTGPDITGEKVFGLQRGSGSGNVNSEEDEVEVEEDVGYAGEQEDWFIFS